MVAEQTVVSLGGGSIGTVPLLYGSLREGAAWFASSGSVESLLCYWPRPGSDPPCLCFPAFPCTETGQGIVHALTDLSSPGMTSGNGNSASSITGTAPQNGENKPPQAIVKPQILTHVIEGFVIQEGAEPFPVRTTSFPLFFFFFLISILWMCIRIALHFHVKFLKM